MIAISLLSHTEFGLNDHREDANPFSCYTYAVTIFQGNMSDLLLLNYYVRITSLPFGNEVDHDVSFSNSYCMHRL